MRAAIAALRQRLAMVVARAVVKVVDDAAKMQALQVRVLHDELIDGVEHPQPYGMTAHPHPGAEAFMVFAGGSRGHGIVVVVDDRRYRPTDIEQGEVVLYTDEDQLDGGHRIHFRRGQSIEIQAGKEIRLKVGRDTLLVLTPSGIKMQTADFQADRPNITR